MIGFENLKNTKIVDEIQRMLELYYGHIMNMYQMQDNLFFHFHYSGR